MAVTMESDPAFTALMIVLAATVAQAFPLGDIECNKMSSVLREFEGCLLLNGTSAELTFFWRTLQGAKTFTRDELLVELELTCRNSEIKQRYLNCGEMINNDCPAIDLQDYVATNTDERLAVFCENNIVSSWIRGVLPDNYTLHTDCLTPRNPVIALTQECLRNFSKPDKAHKWDQSVEKVLAILYEVHKEWFLCTIDQAKEAFPVDMQLDCGMPWQDLLLFYWLFRSSSDVLGPVIGNEEITRLQEMMMSRV